MSTFNVVVPSEANPVNVDYIPHPKKNASLDNGKVRNRNIQILRTRPDFSRIYTQNQKALWRWKPDIIVFIEKSNDIWLEIWRIFLIRKQVIHFMLKFNN